MGTDYVRVFNKACSELPDGWMVLVNLERGSGWPELYNADGADVTAKVNLDDKDLDEAIMALVQYAIETVGH